MTNLNGYDLEDLMTINGVKEPFASNLIKDITALIEAERIAGAVEELKRLKVDSNGYGGDTAYYEAPFYVVPQSEIDARLAELEGEK